MGWLLRLTHIILLASSVATETILNTAITSDIQLSVAGSPYVAHDDVVVEAGATLTVDAGVTVQFAAGKGLDIHGMIRSEGQSDNPVAFVALEPPTVEIENNAIRLVGGGNRTDKGIVEIYDGSSWFTYCDYRMSSLTQQTSWMKNIAKVVCRQLHFVEYVEARLEMIAPNSTDDLRNQNYYTCQGTELELQDCSRGYTRCDSGINAVQVVCDSVHISSTYWGGIHFMNDTDSSLSSLHYTTISEAGLRKGENISATWASSLLLSGSIPSLGNVSILNSAHHGLTVVQGDDYQELSSVSVQRSLHDGIYLTEPKESGMSVHDIRIDESGGHGMHLEGANLFLDDAIFKDFCSVQCIRCVLDESEFPLHFIIRQNGEGIACQAAFTTTPGKVLALRILEMSTNYHITIQDGALIDSPYLLNSTLYPSVWPYIAPVMVTDSNTINVAVNEHYSWNTGFIKFTVYSGISAHLGMDISSVTTLNNKRSGIYVNNYQLPIFVNELISGNNDNGVLVEESSLFVMLNASRISSNRNVGFMTSNSDGLYCVSQSELEDNSVGINILHDHNNCHYSYVTSRSMHSLSVSESKIAHNSLAGISYVYNCRSSLTIVSNTLENNPEAVNVEYSGYYRIKNDITIDNNDVSNNDYGCRIQTQGTLNMAFTGNNVTSNNGPALYLRQQSTYERGLITISDNIFEDNDVRGGELVSVVLAKYIYTDDVEIPFSMNWNVFRNNKIEPALPYFVYTYQAFGAILHMKTDDNVDMRYNIFDNPGANYQVAIPDTNTEYTINATYCYWGSSDISVIVRSVFVYQDISFLTFQKIIYHPYLNSGNFSDYDEQNIQHPQFQLGVEIGGTIYGSETLSNVVDAYDVVSDIIIPEGAVLTINPAVKMNFRWGISIQVYGLLHMVGNPDERIELTASQNPTTELVRFVTGTLPWIGFVEYLIDDVWLPVCYNYNLDQETLNFLCHAGGYQTRTSSIGKNLQYTPETNKSVSSLKCLGKYSSDCLVQDNDLCTGNQHLYMECVPNYWSGIHFTVHAKPTKVAHVDLNFAAFPFNDKTTQSVMQIDYHRHHLSNIAFSNIFPSSQSKGILVIIASAFSQDIDEVLIKMNSGFGIASYDQRIMIQHSNIESADYGVYISTRDVDLHINSSVVLDLCFANNSYILEDDEELFLQITDRDSKNYLKTCDSYIQSATGKPITVQIVEDTYYGGNCNNENDLSIYDGHMNDSKSSNLSRDYTWKEGWVFPNDGVHFVFTDYWSRYYYDCIDIVVLVTVDNRQQGDNVDLITKTVLKNVTFSQMSQSGIYLDGLASKGIFIELLHPIFTESHFGLFVYNIVPLISIEDGLFESNDYGIYCYNSQGSIAIWNTTFQRNDYACRLQYTGSNNIQIKSSYFSQNDYLMDINYPYSTTKITLDGNMFEDNTKGIYCTETFSRHYLNLVLQNNIFTGFEEAAIYVYGQGEIIANVFRGNMVNVTLIEIVSTYDDFRFEKNVIDSNWGTTMLDFHLVSAFVSISENVINRNNVSAHLWHLTQKVPHNFSEQVSFSNNLLTDNIPQDECFPSSVIIMTGQMPVKGRANVLNNPLFKAELQSTTPTLNSSTSLDFKYNFWGTNNAKDVKTRIDDRNAADNAMPVQFVPFYGDETLENTVDSQSDNSLTEMILMGRLQQSLTIKQYETYQVQSDLVIPPGIVLSMLPGSRLEIQQNKTIHVEGSFLATGSPESPIEIVTKALNLSDYCGVRMQHTGPFEGVVEVKENGQFSPVCYSSWTNENSKVVCRSLGFGKPVSVTSGSGSVYHSIRKFLCTGTEHSLAECKYNLDNVNCHYRYMVRLTCSSPDVSLDKSQIIFRARPSEQQSLLQHVLIKSVASVHVMYLSPVIDNLDMIDSDNGIVFTGTGAINDNDIVIKNTAVKQSNGNALAFYNITSNVTIENVKMEEIGANGITITPLNTDTELFATAGHSTFIFCDGEITLNILPGEEHHFYGHNDGSSEMNCKRVFSTVDDYVIHLEIKASDHYSHYFSKIFAEVYDGVIGKDFSKIYTYTVSRYTSRTAGTVQSISSHMTVEIPVSEYHILFATVRSIKKTASDCNFENGVCGGANYGDIFQSFKGQWFLYDCSSLEFSSFQGLQADVNFPFTTDGHYLVAGVNTSTNCSYYYQSHASEEAIYETAAIDGSSNICSVSFSHYRKTSNSRRAEGLTLYIKQNSTLRQLWYDSTYTSTWKKVNVPLDLTAFNQSFTLLFHAQYTEDCSNSIGLDDITFLPCPEEKFVSTIRIVNTDITRVGGEAIWVWNTDVEKHNILWIERVSVHDSGKNIQEGSLINLNIKSAYVLVRNVDLKQSHGQALQIVFQSQTQNRISEASVTQNSFSYNTYGGIIFMENNGVNNAIFWVDSNVVIHNSGPESSNTVYIVNATVHFRNNFLYNNTAGHILQLENQENVTDLLQTCETNTFWLNIPYNGIVKQTIVLMAAKVEFHNNVINNPTADIEMASSDVLTGNYSLNCSNNWWGSGLQSVASSKILDGENVEGLAYIDIDPIHVNPNPSFSLSSSCPLGWQRSVGVCYFYNVGSVSNYNAQKTCAERDAIPMTENYIDREFINQVTLYRDADGSQKYTSVWLNTDINAINARPDTCKLLKSSVNSFYETSTANCDDLYPFVCLKTSIVLCKNNCFQQGRCIGTTCLCNQGYEGTDCSTFHCRDVNNCNGQGECVGPNQCQCKDGWTGRACSSSYCPRYRNCNLCVRKLGCGWCDTFQECLPGTGYEADVGQCPAWFYYKCATTDGSTTCSSQIETISCSRLCNVNSSDFSLRSCQECKDMSQCYNETTTCNTWSEEKCPSGVVLANYDDTSHTNTAVFSDDVRVVDPEKTVLHYCPYRLSEVEDKRNLFIATSVFKFDVNDIIVSSQSEGIMHKVDYKTNIDGLTFFTGVPVGLSDILKTADFRATVPVEDIMHILTQEPEIDMDLLQEILNSFVEVDETLVIFQNNEPMFKCAGHVYEKDDNTLGYSYHLVIPKSNIPGEGLQTGSIIVSNRTYGYLETVVEVLQTSMGTFAVTNLTQCTPENIQSLDIETLHIPSMSCYGGNGWPGLLNFNGTLSEEKLIGKTVVGRKSKEVLAKVISITDAQDYMFIEVVNVEYIENESAIISADPVHFVTEHRRSRRSISNFFKTIGKSIGLDVKGSASVTPTFTVNANLDVIVRSKWIWWKFKYEWDYSVSLGGSVTLGCTASYSLSASGSFFGKKELLNVNLAKFAIPVLGVPIIGLARLKVEFGWKVSAGGEVSFTVGGSVNAGFSAGFATGNLPKPKREITGGADTTWSAKVKDLEIAVEVSVTPALYAIWPAVTSVFEIGNEDHVPITVATETGVTVQVGTSDKFKFHLEAELGSPFILKASAKGCDESCNDPLKPLRLGITYGLSEVYVKVSAFSYFIKVGGATPSLTHFIGDCHEQDFDCCTCEDGKTGKWDKENEECLCDCCCDPPGGPVDESCEQKSTTDHTGECQCEECPDGSLKKWSADIKCPCTCADGTEKEMEEDGSCDCSCTCPDGSSDVIDSRGECPCECTCKNCEPSTLGVAGCQCPRDICPSCEDGSVAEWAACECKCPDPECGVHPLCASGRRGNNCDQLDCSPCQGCSGNGVCTGSTTGCSSWCRCFQSWTGSCCDVRRPRNMWGDPHLETLDGIAFDYFGIGQYWDCKSEANDFGLQVRYFYYGQASFTGAIALKVGEDVVTVTTLSNCSVIDMPILRINGEVISVTESPPIALEEIATINLEPRPSSSSEEDTAVLLVPIKFKSAVDVTLDIRYSPVMSRQYMNVLFTPTASFKYNTSGLCGYMDDDDSNDLMGPSGEIFTNTDQFALSWEISDMTRENGGTKSSWSWTESNFHINDTFDISYNDPTYQPSYDISGFTEAEVEIATSSCVSMGITGNLLDGCIFDVVITGDTTMAQQDTLQIGCPRQCSGKGRCLNSTCSCIEGWSEEDCSVGQCGVCVFGQCDQSFCQCESGWDGSTCNVTATCDGVNNCTDELHGICHRIDKCLCNTGFVGSDCSLTATCYSVSNCSNHGTCVDFDKCECSLGYAGDSCSEFSCEDVNYCSSQGQCTGFDYCLCDIGWKGMSCATPDCSTVDSCSGNGNCVGPGQCTCLPGYTGNDCSQEITCPTLQDCNGNGVCDVILIDNNGSDEYQSICRCDHGYTGSNCADSDCSSLNNCSSHGTCSEPNLCDCEQGYGGSMCESFTCDIINKCSGHGECNNYNNCTCDDGWSSEDCSEADCSALSDCSAQGICTAPNTCDCYDGYEGDRCSESAAENMNPPIFEPQTYELTIREDIGVPHVLLTVFAMDDDEGRNGEVRYTIDPSSVSFDIGNYMEMDISGSLTLKSAIPRAIVPSGTTTISVIAEDRGVPSRTDIAEVIINITDINECPSIIAPSQGQVFYLNESIPVGTQILTVLVEDNDFDLNKEILFGLVESEFVEIDQDNGTVIVISQPTTTGDFVLIIQATDKATSPCMVEVSVILRVVPKDIQVLTAAPETGVTSEQMITVIGTSEPTLEQTSSSTSPTSPTTTLNGITTVKTKHDTLSSSKGPGTSTEPKTSKPDEVSETSPADISTLTSVKTTSEVTTVTPIESNTDNPTSTTIEDKQISTETTKKTITVETTSQVTTVTPIESNTDNPTSTTTEDKQTSTGTTKKATSITSPQSTSTVRVSTDVVTALTADAATDSSTKPDDGMTSSESDTSSMVNDATKQTTNNIVEVESSNQTPLIAVGVVLGVFVIGSIGITALVCLKHSQAQAAKKAALYQSNRFSEGPNPDSPSGSAWRWRPYYY